MYASKPGGCDACAGCSTYDWLLVNSRPERASSQIRINSGPFCMRRQTNSITFLSHTENAENSELFKWLVASG